MIEIVVKPQDGGKKVHRFVRQLLPGVPLSGVYKMLRTGRVKRNGRRVKQDDVLRTGDQLQLYMAEADFAQSTRAVKKFGGVSRDVAIVYEDEEIVVASKPVGLLVHGTEGERKDTLVNRVQAVLFDRSLTSLGSTDTEYPPDANTQLATGDVMDGVYSVAPVHRLDRNTSGLVVFSKTSATAAELAAQISEHRLRKWYLAIVRGTLPDHGEIGLALRRERTGNRTVAVPNDDPDAKQALSRYECKATAGGTSVAKVELVSGRTHQIRAHFQEIGHPLWGDVKYGGRTDVNDSPEQHQWLHAAWIELPTGLRVHAALPVPFEQVLQRLGYTPEQLRAIEQF